MKKLNHVKLFESFLINEKFETENFNSFKRAHPVGSKFVKHWFMGAKEGDKETCEITDYKDGDPTDESFVKSKNVVFTNPDGDETKINHNELYNLEKERVDMSSRTYYITWK